ncbi:MAG: DNA (cytosine-5-)-methyltransferase, partial [Nitrosopumilus sp.]
GYIKHLNEIENNHSEIKFEPIIKPIDASDSGEQRRLGEEHYGITGIIGGPPCQDYSVGGKNAGIKGDRGKLINSYYKIVKNVRPDFIFFENVDGLFTTKKHKNVFLSLVRKLGLIGYKVYYDILNSLDYGIPQDRQRLTMVAFRRPIVDT